MTTQQISHIRVKEPRKLEAKETLQSLLQWKMQFKQYIKRDDHFKTFLSSDSSWDPNAANFGFNTETGGLRRSAAALKDDCTDFLCTLATFLPHGYLTEKLVYNTTSFADAFKVIQEHYGLLPSQESFLDLMSFNKMIGESYRQYYERLMAHVRQHLHVEQGVSADGAIVPDGGDKITVSHANLVTLVWLYKIHPELINIVRTEYSLELRDNKPLASLVPRVAVNIDNLLAKFDKVGHVTRIYQESDDNLQHNVSKTFVKREGAMKEKALFCPGCFGISKSSKTKIHYRHLPIECPRKVVVKYIEVEDVENQLEDLAIDTEGNYDNLSYETLNHVQQVKTAHNEINYQNLPVCAMIENECE